MSRLGRHQHEHTLQGNTAIGVATYTLEARLPKIYLGRKGWLAPAPVKPKPKERH